ncbi:MAG: M20/M25/M40 family metallo-hydrolase [Deltaproteobacteria bacterium]|nr:M20/M25/M40 family metallo-hydrolase [Deltaproteobacteria bacterium]
MLLLAACARQPLEEAPPEGAPTPAPAAEGEEAPRPTPAEATGLHPGDLRAHVGAGLQDGPLHAILSAGRAQPGAMATLTTLCDDIGHRLAGSPGLDQAVVWADGVLRGLPAVRAWTEPVMVPVWRRGRERAWVTAPRALELPMLGLGGSGGTPGVEAEVVLAESPETVGPEVAGKIVLFDKVMQPLRPGEVGYRGREAYSEAVGIRGGGPAAAARNGAVGALVRSVTGASLGTPHTGGTWFGDARPIPAAAITPEHAGWMRRLLSRGVPVRVRLEMEAQTLPDALSHNVLGELRGERWPEEIVLIGAHLDSWDVGQGAQDDGAGVAQVLEAMRLLAAAERPPGRTVRAVLFTNEENGLRGGKAYAQVHGGEHHVAAIESDLGAGWPVQLDADGDDVQRAFLSAAAAPLGLPVVAGEGGADIGPLGEHGVLLVNLIPDDRHYFDVHHTWADTLDKVDPEALQEGALVLAGLAWALADAPTAPGPTAPRP